MIYTNIPYTPNTEDKNFWNKYFHENSQEFDLNKIFLPK